MEEARVAKPRHSVNNPQFVASHPLSAAMYYYCCSRELTYNSTPPYFLADVQTTYSHRAVRVSWHLALSRFPYLVVLVGGFESHTRL